MSKKFSSFSLCFSLVLIFSSPAQRSFAADVETAGDLKVTGMIDNTGGAGIKFPDGNTQTTACSGCANGILSISLGGTGASNSTTALTNLGAVNKTGDTMSGNLSVPSISISGNLTLPTTTATAGIIKSGASTLIHTYGDSNFFAGYHAGNLTMTGNSNTASGYMALWQNTTGSNNTANGNTALYSNTTGSGNTVIGSAALGYNTTGGYNTASGYQTLWVNTTGSENTASGWGALFYNTTGYGNTADGRGALGANTTGFRNTALGYAAGDGRQTGSYNTFIGANTDAGADGLTNATAIGYNAVVGASNSLVLGGTGANAVKVGIGTATPTETLDVVGNVRLNNREIFLRDGTDVNHGLGWYNNSTKVFTGADIDGPVLYGYTGGALGTTSGEQRTIMKWNWSSGLDFYGYARFHTLSGGSTSACLDGYNTISTCSSDARLKKDVVTLSDKMNVLEALDNLRGVMFSWDRTNAKAARMGSELDLGMIAQEVETVFPEIVHTDSDGYKSMDYPKLVAFLVEVNKAQQAEIKNLTKVIEDINKRLSLIESKK